MEGKVCLCMLFYSPFPVAVTVISAAVLSVSHLWLGMQISAQTCG